MCDLVLFCEISFDSVWAVLKIPLCEWKVSTVMETECMVMRELAVWCNANQTRPYLVIIRDPDRCTDQRNGNHVNTAAASSKWDLVSRLRVTAAAATELFWAFSVHRKYISNIRVDYSDSCPSTRIPRNRKALCTPNFSCFPVRKKTCSFYLNAGLGRGSRSLGHWDRGFESHPVIDVCSASLCIALFCMGTCFATGWSGTGEARQ